MVTHDWRFLAKMAAQLIVMHSGRIVETGSPQAILGQPAHPYTRQLLEIQRAIRLGQWPEEVLLSNDKCS
jgi:peptide/nickel transport system ATP-binding protein